MRYILIVVSSIMLIFSLESCGITDNDQPIPYYLDLKNVQTTEPLTGAPGTHKMTEIWVFADGQIQGVYPLPAKVPLIWEDRQTTIRILPGIRNNGMNDTPVLYPFLKEIELTITPEQLKVYTVPLVFRYIDNCKFSVNENFENSNIFNFYLDPNSESRLEQTTDMASTGQKSAAITLTKAGVFTEIGSAIEVVKGQNLRGKSYVEFDYKGEGEIAVGIAKTLGTITTIEYFLFVPAKPDWNRIYVDVTDKTSSNNYDTYRLLLGFTKTGNSAETKIYIDNYKHIHF